LEVSEDAGGEEAFGEEAEGEPGDAAAMDGSVGEALEVMTVGGDLEALAKGADCLVGGAGVDDIAMEEQAVLEADGEFMPLEVGGSDGEGFEGTQVCRDGVVISHDNDEPAVRMFLTEVMEKGGGGGDGVGERAVPGPFEVEDIAIEDEEIDIVGDLMDLVHIRPTMGVVAKEVQVGDGGAALHGRKKTD
jgi:hypothetical protein